MNFALLGAYGAAVAFDILFPLLVAFVIWRRLRVAWRFFWFGALVFFVTQILIRIPLTQGAQFLLREPLQGSQTFLYFWFAVLALTAGIFEEGGRWLGYRWLVKKDFTWAKGLMYGAGHGGLESMLLVGGLALLGLVNVIVISTTNFSQMNLPPDQLAQIEMARRQIAALEWWMPLLGAYERFITLFFQIAMSILVLQVFVRGSLKWLWLAIALHAGIDFAAILLARALAPVWVEAALTLSLPLSLFIIFYFRPRENDAARDPAPNSPA